jgi:hypothetical protein
MKIRNGCPDAASVGLHRLEAAEEVEPGACKRPASVPACGRWSAAGGRDGGRAGQRLLDAKDPRGAW